MRGSKGDLSMPSAVMLLPTPVCEPDTGNGHARNLGKEIQLLPTPRARDKGTESDYSSPGFRPTLTQSLMLPTPKASDSDTPNNAANAARRSPGMGAADFHRDRWAKYALAIERWERITGRDAPDPVVIGPKGGRVLNPRLVEWMMGLLPGWVTDVPGLSRAQYLKILGNGVVPQQAEAALDEILTDWIPETWKV